MQHAAESTRSLVTCLQSLNKDELHRIRRTLDVKNASGMNKHDLVQCLSERIIDQFAHSVGLMDIQRYQVLQKVREAGGIVTLSSLFDDGLYDPVYFQDYGFLFGYGNKEEVIMPDEVLLQLQQVDQVWLRTRLRRNTEWIRLTKGLLYYYGTLSIRQLLEFIKQYTNQTAEYVEYWHVMQDFASYDEGITVSAYGLSHFMVDDPSRISYEHEIRPTVDYYPFTKEQILQAGEEDYIERNQAYRNIVSFLRQHWIMDSEEADMLVEELVYDIQMGSMPGDLIDRLQSEIEVGDMKQLQILVDRLVILMNETRQWVLKGYSPNELRNEMQSDVVPEASGADIYDFHTRKKVGRNDPCPCGSGKKFKKCCGS